MKRLAYILLILLVPALAYAYVVGTPSNMVPGNWQAFAVDPGAPDSGVTSTAHVTLKNLVTAIGTTKKQTIIFPHTGSGTTTQYTIGTALDLSSYSNITFQFENGAQLKVSAGASGVTLPSPANVSAQPNQQIMSGTSLFFSEPGTIYPNWFSDSVGDGSTVASTVFRTAIVAAAPGSTIKVLPATSYYNFTSGVTITKALRVSGDETSLADIRQATAATTVFIVTASNVEIDHLKFTGPQYAIFANEYGINTYGADSSNYITGLKIHDCEFSTFGYGGILMEFVSDFFISENKISNCYYAGMMILSCSRGSISGNNINNIVGTTNAYGISMSRTTSASLVTNPRCSDITVTGNTVKDVTSWNGIDTHAGQRLTIANNVVLGCLNGIAIGSAKSNATDYAYAPLQVNVTGNVVDSYGITAGEAGYGIAFTGAYNAGTVESATGVISGNIVQDYGDQDLSTGCAVYLHTTKALVFNGNIIIRPSRYGILFAGENYGINIINNTIMDGWSETGSAIGMLFNFANQTGYIDGNSFFTRDYTSGVKTFTMDLSSGEAVRIANVANVVIEFGKNYNRTGNSIDDINFTTVLRGMSYGQTSGNTEAILVSQTIPANGFQYGERLRITGAGTKSGGNDIKRLKFWFGTSGVTFVYPQNDTEDWRFQAEIYPFTNTSQRISWVGYSGTTVIQGYDTANATLTSGTTVGFSGECAHSGDTIYQRMFFIEKF